MFEIIGQKVNFKFKLFPYCFGLSKLFRQCRSWHVTQCRPINSPHIAKRFDSSAFLCFHMYRQSVIGQCVVSIHRRYRNLHLRDLFWKSNNLSLACHMWLRMSCEKYLRDHRRAMDKFSRSASVYFHIKLLKHECYGYHVRALFVRLVETFKLSFECFYFREQTFWAIFIANLHWLSGYVLTAHFDLALIAITRLLENSCRLESTRVCAKCQAQPCQLNRSNWKISKKIKPPSADIIERKKYRKKYFDIPACLID